MWLMIVVLGLLVALLLLVELGVFGGGGGAPAAPDPLDAIVEAEGMPPTDAKKGSTAACSSSDRPRLIYSRYV